MATNEDKRYPNGGDDARPTPREVSAEPAPPPRPRPEPEEAPELLGERSDYPIPRGDE